MTDSLIAMPGDADLDCHLEALRITAVVETTRSGHATEAILGLDLTRAAGWWASDGKRCYTEGEDEAPLRFELAAAPGADRFAAASVSVLRQWARDGTFLTLSSAPGKFTRIAGRDGNVVVLPRSAETADAGSER